LGDGKKKKQEDSPFGNKVDEERHKRGEVDVGGGEGLEKNAGRKIRKKKKKKSRKICRVRRPSVVHKKGETGSGFSRSPVKKKRRSHV